MTSSAVCRACLSSCVRMYHIADSGLQEKFEALSKIKITEHTVSHLSTRKPKLSFSRLKSVSINNSPKILTPVTEIKKEVIEIDKNTYAEVVEMSDILRDFENFTESLKMEENQRCDVSMNLEHTEIATAIKQEHQDSHSFINPELSSKNGYKDHDCLQNKKQPIAISENRRCDISMNLEHSEITTFIKQEHRDSHSLINPELSSNNGYKDDDCFILESKEQPIVVHQNLTRDIPMNLEHSEIATFIKHEHRDSHSFINPELSSNNGYKDDDCIILESKEQSIVTHENQTCDIPMNLEHTGVAAFIKQEKRYNHSFVNLELASKNGREDHDCFLLESKEQPLVIHQNQACDIPMDLEHCGLAASIKEEQRDSHSLINLELSSMNGYKDHDCLILENEEQPIVIHQNQTCDILMNLEHTGVAAFIKQEKRDSHSFVNPELSSNNGYKDDECFILESKEQPIVTHENQTCDIPMNLEHTGFAAFIKQEKRDSHSFVNLELSSKNGCEDDDCFLLESNEQPIVTHENQTCDIPMNLEHAGVAAFIKQEKRDSHSFIKLSSKNGRKDHDCLILENNEQPIVIHENQRCEIPMNLEPLEVATCVKQDKRDNHSFKNLELSSKNGNKDHDCFILESKEQPIVIDECEPDMGSENEEMPLVIDEQECYSLEQLQQLQLSLMKSIQLEQCAIEEPVVADTKQPKNNNNLNTIESRTKFKNRNARFSSLFGCISNFEKQSPSKEVSKRSDRSLLKPSDLGMHRADPNKDDHLNNGSQFLPKVHGTRTYYKDDQLEQSSVKKRRRKRKELSFANDANDYQYYYCNDCFRSFKSRSKLNRHIRKIHPEKNIMIFECDRCGVIFNLEKDLKEHLKSDHSEKHGTRTFKITNKDDPLEQSSVQKRRKKKEFYFANDANDYQYYYCDDCFRSFKSRSKLNRHIRKIHPKKNIFECDRCGFIFNLEKDLKEHLKSKHLYPCDRCRKKYQSIKFLLKHRQRVHSEPIKIYSCDKCGKKYVQRLNYKYHILFVHPPVRNNHQDLF